MNLFILLILSFIFSATASFSQNSGIKSTVLLKGRVLNFKTMTPIETKFFLVQNDGKKIQVKSSSDGSFYIPLSSSGEYTVQSDNWLCIEPLTINISVGEQYTEQNVALYFLPFEVGLVLKKVKGFDPNTQELTNAGKEALQFICNLNKSTPKLNYTIKLVIEPKQFKSETKTVFEGKKRKKITITAREKAEKFSKSLIEKINVLLASCKMPSRKYSYQIEYITESRPTKGSKKSHKSPSSGKDNKLHYNLEISISDILKTDLEEKK